MSNRTPSINQVIISGNIVQDAVIKHVGDKKTPVTTLRIANNQSYRDKENKWQEKATFLDVEVWGSRAEKGEKYYKKGIPIIIEGNLKENQWEDKDGNRHSKILIHASKIHILKYPDK